MTQKLIDDAGETQRNELWSVGDPFILAVARKTPEFGNFDFSRIIAKFCL